MNTTRQRIWQNVKKKIKSMLVFVRNPEVQVQLFYHKKKNPHRPNEGIRVNRHLHRLGVDQSHVRNRDPDLVQEVRRENDILVVVDEDAASQGLSQDHHHRRGGHLLHLQ